MVRGSRLRHKDKILNGRGGRWGPSPAFLSKSFRYCSRMNLLPFGKLPAAKPRTFVPQTIDLGDWSQIAPLFDQLEALAARAKGADALEEWLLAWSEFNAALDEESSRRYIAMTCHTDSPEAEKAYLHFV